ncbi:MAG: hypothetical protein DKM50_13460 [Candidatus Margulisiibacteriota bacterium]|nr:MAG: hypothetical protein A2X43_07330 [Candidatus Margulisbacteria bacterium GWD2_39_127]OGI01960.1 MAG: hypothetical protein A2X42_09785 [Candidatus Margulisbacteria bacterium GWF2_38_17]PZM77286.1 MAG: hypothetical protein DKM50_13460 [Candidatus Margulisiibacteriota bacterium]HAR62925.1 hypothetical protein [Candidatus Margulisiibacteriota bacterium]HCT85932.1 hypothetical protein [Candidatus Margulisiibacteriota bacterium]
MKKIIALLCLIVVLSFSSTSVFAQDGMKWGLKLGVNGNTFIGDDAKSTRMTGGFNAGVFSEWRLNDNFIIQPELIFTKKGGKATLPDEFGEVNLLLNYLELPILFKYNLPMDWVEANVFAGPYFSHLFSVNDKQDIEDRNTLKKFNRFDWGVVVGVGAGFNTFLGKVGLDARYDMGLQNLDEKANDDFRNGVGSINLSYAL